MSTGRMTAIYKCRCGALGVVTTDSDVVYHMRPKTWKAITGSTWVPKPSTRVCSCDHCVNHWGVDICACGSGEPPEKCDGGYPECGSPMQELGGRTHVRAESAWGGM